jgi:hypothetical protein
VLILTRQANGQRIGGKVGQRNQRLCRAKTPNRENPVVKVQAPACRPTDEKRAGGCGCGSFGERDENLCPNTLRI